MQWNLYVNQKFFSEEHPNLDLKDAVLFDYLRNFYPYAKKKNAYAYLSYRYALENLPLLKIKSSEVVGRRMKKLKASGLIDFHYDLKEAKIYYLLKKEAMKHPPKKSSASAEEPEEIEREAFLEDGLARSKDSEAKGFSLEAYVEKMNEERGFTCPREASWKKIQAAYERSAQRGGNLPNPVEVLEEATKDEFWGTKAFLSRHYHHYQSLYYRRSRSLANPQSAVFAKTKTSRRPLFFNTDELLFGRLQDDKESQNGT